MSREEITINPFFSTSAKVKRNAFSVTASFWMEIKKADKNGDLYLDKAELGELYKNNKEIAQLSEEEVLDIFDEILLEDEEFDLQEDLQMDEVDLLDEISDDELLNLNEETQEDEIPFFITQENEEANWSEYLKTEEEFNELILNGGVLSDETAELKIKNNENLKNIYDKILEQKLNNPDITDEELSELYTQLNQYLQERKTIEQTILDELSAIEENSQDVEKSQQATDLKNKLISIQENRADFNYAQTDFALDSAVQEDEQIQTLEDVMSGNTGGGGIAPGSYTPEVAQKTSETMSLDELKQEVNNKENSYKDSQEEVKKVLSGDNQAIKQQEDALKLAQEEYDKILQEAIKENPAVEQKKEELNQKEDQISNQEQLIKDEKINLYNIDCVISEINLTIKTCDEIIASYEMAKAAWESSANVEGADKAEIDSAIKDIDIQIAQQQAKKEDSLKLLEQKEQDKIKINEKILKAQEQLNVLNSEKEGIEAQIQALLTENPQLSEQIKQMSQLVKTQKEELEKIKEVELKKAQDALSLKEKEYNDIKVIYERRSQAPQYPTKMEHLVEYGAQKYLSVLSADEIEELKQYAAKNGFANIYKGWEDKCLHAAYEYELYAEGSKAGNLNQYMSESLDETIAKMAETLNNGNTVVAKVNTKKGTRHFVLVIGIRQGATAPCQQSDFLCIDSYDHDVDAMGQSGQGALDSGDYRTLYSQHGKYWLGSHVTNFA